MDVANKIAVITGGASGIGAALARRFKAEGAKAIAIADRQHEPLRDLAAELGALAVPCDVCKESEVANLVSQVESQLGPIDIFCSNAGVARWGEEDAPNDEWQLNFDIHVMAHVYAVRAVAPLMAGRGSGYLIHTASAAGLLSHVRSATYTVSKHAAVAFAEWVAIKYRHLGVHVSVLAPQAVRTPMTEGPGGASVARDDGMIEVEQLADSVIKSMAAEEFLILPHPQVLDYMMNKTADVDRWIAGMNRWRQKTLSADTE